MYLFALECGNQILQLQCGQWEVYVRPVVGYADFYVIWICHLV